MAKRPTYYEVVNFKGKNLQASPNRVFIYVLMLNIPNTKNSKPYYVGYADNLNFRFSNHAELNWHWNKFLNPVKVFIAGTVPEVLGERLASALAQAYNDAGYIIKNDVIKRQNIDMKLMTDDDFLNYSNSEEEENNIIEEWATRWHVKTGSVQKPKQTYVTTFTPPLVTSEKIKEYIETVEMVAGVRVLANRIAKEYNKETGYSTIVLQKEDKEYMKSLSHIWLPEKIIYHQPVRIRLTKRAAEAVKALNN